MINYISSRRIGNHGGLIDDHMYFRIYRTSDFHFSYMLKWKRNVCLSKESWWLLCFHHFYYYYLFVYFDISISYNIKGSFFVVLWFGWVMLLTAFLVHMLSYGGLVSPSINTLKRYSTSEKQIKSGSFSSSSCSYNNVIGYCYTSIMSYLIKLSICDTIPWSWIITSA